MLQGCLTSWLIILHVRISRQIEYLIRLDSSLIGFVFYLFYFGVINPQYRGMY